MKAIKLNHLLPCTLVGGLLALAAGVAAPAFAAQVVVLKAGSATEMGQGFLTHHAGRCFAVMPWHVAQEHPSPLDLRREGVSPRYGEAGAGVDLGDDAAIATVSGVDIADCGIAASTVGRAVEPHLRGAGIASLRTVNGDGTIANMPVAIVDNDRRLLLRIQPTHARHQFRKGLSGSQLMVNHAMIGMLMSVNARSGVGTVLRQDALMRKVGDYLAGSGPPPSSIVAPSGLTVKAWSSLPMPADSRATNLVLPDAEKTVWRTVAENWPATLDFAREDSANVWSGIVLDARGIPRDERPGRAEVSLQLGSGTSTWRSVLSTTLTYVDDMATVRFAPSRGAVMRLRLWPAESTAPMKDRSGKRAAAVSLRRVFLPKN